LSFKPRMPKGLRRLRFPLAVREQVLEVEIRAQTACYRLRKGEKLTFHHWDQEITLFEGESKIIQIDS
jgi:alpha,alpha-trehalose phosphorylase